MSTLRKIVAGLALLLVGAGLRGAPAPPNGGPPSTPAAPDPLYHPDPNHLWNRVHAALFVRTGPDGRTYGHDRLEPLLWAQSKHLADGPAADRAVAVLEEFVRTNGERLVDDPLKRAVLQRDLWLVFNGLSRDTADGGVDPAAERLGLPLAAVIRRLALPPEQVAKLPDTYAAAVASKRFADRFDPDQPDRPYLPPDLFVADGPWACVGRPDGPAAPMHLQETGTNRFTNSVFFVFVKLPGGRAASLDFVARVRAVAQPMLPVAVDEAGRTSPPTQNPALPPLPKGTEVALVRRALLVDAGRSVVASPLAEGVQVRVYRAEAPSPPAGQAAGGLAPYLTPEVAARQAFFEFQLRRADLFAVGPAAVAAGGLRDVSGERDFKTGFNAHGWDEFERPTDDSSPPPDRPSVPGPRPAGGQQPGVVRDVPRVADDVRVPERDCGAVRRGRPAAAEHAGRDDGRRGRAGGRPVETGAAGVDGAAEVDAGVKRSSHRLARRYGDMVVPIDNPKGATHG